MPNVALVEPGRTLKPRRPKRQSAAQLEIAYLRAEIKRLEQEIIVLRSQQYR